MDDKVLRIIDTINWQVFYFNRNTESRDYNTELVRDPRASALIIKDACQKIIAGNINERIVEYYIDSIEYLCYGGYYDSKSSRLRKNPKMISTILIKYCDDILDIVKSNQSKLIERLNEKYTKKWIYFEGYESGSYIIWITNIQYVNETIVWSGAKIDLNTVNCTPDHGICFIPVEKSSFINIGCDGDEEQFLHESEIFTNEQVKAKLNNWLFWGFDHIGNDISDENCFDNLYEEFENV